MPTERQTVLRCDVPSKSVLDRRWVEAAYFRDSYQTPLRRPNISVVDIFFAIFAHHPLWMKIILMVRNRIASCCGLEAPTASEIIDIERKDNYRVGDKIGAWPIFCLTDTELVVGRDNRHLDFRLSVLKVVDDESTSVFVSTICSVHNTFGRFYLFVVVPFHKWGMQRLMMNALTAARL